MRPDSCRYLAGVPTSLRAPGTSPGDPATLPRLPPPFAATVPCGPGRRCTTPRVYGRRALSVLLGAWLAASACSGAQSPPSLEPQESACCVSCGLLNRCLGSFESLGEGESDFPVIALACTTREQDSSLLFGHQMPMCTTHSSVLRRAERLG